MVLWAAGRPRGIIATRTTVRVSQPQADARWCRGECLAAGSNEPDEQQIWNRRDYLIGTAGWIRTTDLLIHSHTVSTKSLIFLWLVPNPTLHHGKSSQNWFARPI
jgi:hypothetical protein